MEVMRNDYIRTARSKGLSPIRVITRHALKNALIPVITVMAIQISSLLSGAVITETVFSINGVGRLMVQAISGRDIPLLQATSLLATGMVILGSLLADCLYAVLDPRIRRGD
jgi:peptide/nickel transport system permease protein